jgi:hypothetical protein
LLQARDVADGAKIKNPLLLRVALEFLMLLPGEFQKPPMLAVGGAERVLVVVGAVAKFHRQLAVHVAFLELHGGSAAQGGHVDQFLGDPHLAVVILTDFGNDTAGLTIPDHQRSHRQCFVGELATGELVVRMILVYTTHRRPPT